MYAAEEVWCAALSCTVNQSKRSYLTCNENWQEACLVYHTYRTKKDNEKNQKKPVEYPESMKAV